MTRKIILTRNSKIILADLLRARRPISMKQLAERNGMAWQTVKSNVRRLIKKRLVTCRSSGGKRFCMVKPKVREEFGY